MLQTPPLSSLGEANAAVVVRQSAVTWPAIIAGAVTMTAISLVLLALGSGFGLISVSPWPGAGASVASFGVMAAIWLVVVQWLSAGFGGYLTGRLRTLWVGVHTDEVTFRDTAHGFLAWAVGAVFTVAVLASAVSSVAGNLAQGAATIAGGAAQAAASQAAPNLPDPTGYFADDLLRPSQPTAAATDQQTRGEVARIIATDIKNGTVPDADKTYLAQLVAAKTGLSQADATTRVNTVIGQAQTAANDVATKARQAADAARKAGAYLAIYTALSMMIGAFIASAAAALGGHRRDD